jgi:hypothetical protein
MNFILISRLGLNISEDRAESNDSSILAVHFYPVRLILSFPAHSLCTAHDDQQVKFIESLKAMKLMKVNFQKEREKLEHQTKSYPIFIATLKKLRTMAIRKKDENQQNSAVSACQNLKWPLADRLPGGAMRDYRAANGNSLLLNISYLLFSYTPMGYEFFKVLRIALHQYLVRPLSPESSHVGRPLRNIK